MNEQTKIELLKIAVQLTEATLDKKSSTSKEHLDSFELCFEAIVEKYDELNGKE
jgi:hypothetical protein